MDSSKTVLVTGASGFIGNKLSERLVENGRNICCIYRRKSPPEDLQKLGKQGAKLIRMDIAPQKTSGISFKEELFHVLSGVGTVYHLASLTSDWGNTATFTRINVDGTINLLEVAKTAGVKRFIYVSSLSIHGFGVHRSSIEEGPYYPPTHTYQRTKKQAEDIALQYNSPEFEVCVLRPGNVYGPNDTTMMFPIFKALEKGFMGTINAGKSLTSPVYIDDLLNALIEAEIAPEMPGEIVNITSGETITWREFIDLAADALGVKRPRKNLPSWLGIPVAYLMNGLWKGVGSSVAPPLTPYRVKQVANDFHFNISKAQRILGYTPKVSCAKGLPLAAKSYLGS